MPVTQREVIYYKQRNRIASLQLAVRIARVILTEEQDADVRRKAACKYYDARETLRNDFGIIY